MDVTTSKEEISLAGNITPHDEHVKLKETNNGVHDMEFFLVRKLVSLFELTCEHLTHTHTTHTHTHHKHFPHTRMHVAYNVDLCSHPRIHSHTFPKACEPEKPCSQKCSPRHMSSNPLSCINSASCLPGENWKSMNKQRSCNAGHQPGVQIPLFPQTQISQV